MGVITKKNDTEHKNIRINIPETYSRFSPYCSYSERKWTKKILEATYVCFEINLLTLISKGTDSGKKST